MPPLFLSLDCCFLQWLVTSSAESDHWNARAGSCVGGVQRSHDSKLSLRGHILFHLDEVPNHLVFSTPPPTQPSNDSVLHTLDLYKSIFHSYITPGALLDQINPRLSFSPFVSLRYPFCFCPPLRSWYHSNSTTKSVLIGSRGPRRDLMSAVMQALIGPGHPPLVRGPAC